MKMKQIPTLIHAILLAHVVLYSRAQTYSCSSCICTQTGGSISIDCSYKDLTEIPELCQENVTQFILFGNKISRIKKNAFMNCSNLIKLHLNRSDIQVLDTGAFEGLSQLQVLNLKQNNLGFDPAQLNKSDVMAPLVNLRFLDMSKNQHLGDNRYRALIFFMRSLPKKKLKTLRLAYITSAYEYSKNDITIDFLESIKSTSLEYLHLAGNFITYFRSMMSPFTPNLRQLCLAMNHLYTYTFLLGLEHLYSLNICFQTFPGYTKHSRFNHQSKTQMFRSSDFSHLPEFQVCDLRYKTFTKTSTHTHRHNDYFSKSLLKNGSTVFPNLFYWPKNLTYVYAEETFNIMTVIPSMTLYLWNHEKIGEAHIDFSQNIIYDFFGRIEMCHPATALHLDFSHNECRNISKNAFGNIFALSIVSLDVSYNNLGLLLSQEGGPFPYLCNLKELDLSYNNIKSISSTVINGSNHPYLESLTLENNNLLDIPTGIGGLINLISLDVSLNRISDMNGDIIAGLVNLVVLDVSMNRISFLNRRVMSELSFAIRRNRTSFELDLTGNPIECSCRSVYFLKWMHRFRRNIVKIASISCFLRGRHIPFSLLEKDILPILERQCLSREWLFVMSGILISVLICVTVSVIAYRHRWDIKYFCLRLKIRRELYADLFEESGAFQYDAFVTYSQRDSAWVEGHLIPNLEEGEASLRLCVHHRDFEIGRLIEESILRSISNSRKTIIVLSQHFIRSGWCKFEMHMARVHMMERGVDKIVVVMLEEVPTDDMPHTLVGIMRRHTYIVWPGENMIEKVPEFWSRLRSALC